MVEVDMKIYYCKDCDKEIYWKTALYGQGRCNSCAQKFIFKDLKNHPSYVDGRCSKIHYCKESRCNNKTTYQTVFFGSGLCRSCASKGKNNPNFDNHKLVGKNNPNWQGGIGKLPYAFEFNKKLKYKIRKRDHYKCQICDCSQVENGKQLDVHHIDYNKENNTEINLISLCISCHMKTNGNRDYWFAYFRYITKYK